MNDLIDPTDHDLLLRTHQGSPEAAQALWQRFGGRMIALACTVLRERDTLTAQDVVQGVFLRLLSLDARVIREVEDVAAWLSRLTRNAALNHIRENSRRRARVARATEGRVVFQASDAVKSITGPAARGTLRALIDSLPESQRDTILLKHVANLTFDQMASVLGDNRNTLASRYRAGIAALRELLGERFRNGGGGGDFTPPIQFLEPVGDGGGGGGGGRGRG